MRSENPECDWPEDFSHENGNYSCHCGKCGKYFYGHKRRVRCKVCAEQPTPAKPDSKSAESILEECNYNVGPHYRKEDVLDAMRVHTQQLAEENERLRNRVEELEAEIKAMQGHADDEGWVQLHHGRTPMGVCQVECKNEKGEIFRAVYVDFNDEWETEEHVAAWRYIKGGEK